MPSRELSKTIAKNVVKAAPSTRVKGAESQCLEGRYVYGVALGGKTVRLGQIGIEKGNVYTIPYKNLSAIVHNCPTEPYQSKKEEIVKEWVKTHQQVLDKAKKQFDAIIPLGFNIIIQPKDDLTATDQMVKDWLRQDYNKLIAIIQKIKGKDEYGVQISYDAKVISEYITEQSEELKRIRGVMNSKPPGMAYMYKQKLERTMKDKMEKFADEWFKDFYGRIEEHVDAITVEKTKRMASKVMLLNLSCLVSKNKVKSLGKELEKINSMEGFFVHFSGPWPAYSFVHNPVTFAK